MLSARWREIAALWGDIFAGGGYIRWLLNRGDLDADGLYVCKVAVTSYNIKEIGRLKTEFCRPGGAVGVYNQRLLIKVGDRDMLIEGRGQL